MNEHLQQLEALSRDPALRVSPEQRPEIVGNILHHLMRPYFLTRTPEMQKKFSERQYQAFMQALAEYCLREYVDNPEPRLTIEFIKGLHRQFYGNVPSVPVKAVDGTMTTMVPGEFKTTRVLIRRHAVPGQYFDTTAPEDVARDVARLLEMLHDEGVPLFQRYIRLIVDLIHIHPFPDSNGKVAMLLGDLFLLNQGIHPPYYARYKRENEPLVYALYDDYFLNPQRDVSILYPVVLGAYAGSGRVHQTTPLSGISNQPDQVLDKLLEETALSVEGGDLPVGCALTVDGKLVGSHHNTVRSQQGQRFHAERNLLAQLAETALPSGRRVLWVTLEPCLRCAQAIQRFGVDEVVYVLDDPFRGGKTLLAQAGITVTRRGEWERDYLGRVMDFYARYPEFCAVRQFGYALAAWQRHQPLGRGEQVKAVFLHHLAAYLPNVPAARQEEVRRSFLAHVDYLARLSQMECAGTPSIAFIRNLNRALFPPNYRHRAVGNDGVSSETASGEWRRHVLWPHYTEFSAAEAIEADLTALLSRLATKASWQREDALRFIFDFWAIHPFTDANGRMASILADVICLNHGLAPLALDRKNELFYTALMENLSRGVPITEQLHLVDAWNRGQVGIRPRSIYDDQPSAFQTYTRRSGDKRYVGAQVLAKLADQWLNQPFVVTDIGAGTGVIADGILQGLLQRKGMAFEYYYLEPSQASVDYFRTHSRYAALPQVVFHTMPSEDFLLPSSDLIVVVQTMQYVPNPGETLRDIVSVLKPGGLALIVLSHPDSDEWRMLKRLTTKSAAYEYLKEFLDNERIGYEEIVVESAVHISPADRGTPEGDDLLTFYFNLPVTALPAATKEAFWAGLSGFAQDGAISKKEAFFWIGREAGGADSMDRSLPPEARPYWNLRYAAFPRWDDGIQSDWQGLYSVKPEVLALQLAATLPGKVVLDAFCGIGGCAIAFARSGKRVLAVELDECRLEMARNNARVYGVEDRVTFVHGDVTELIDSLHYDAAFFDPPWGGPEYSQKAVFGWDDFLPNPLPLIHAALARCETVALSVPVNFNVAALHLDAYELVLQKAEIGQQLWWLNAYYHKS